MGFLTPKVRNLILEGHQGWSRHANDYWLTHALKVIQDTYGDVASVGRKNKDLLKFGRNTNIGSGAESTLMTLPGSEIHETYVNTNIINSIISTNAGDTEPVKIEGHTIDGNGDFTFVIQEVTLTGQTVVPLTTALARVTRVYNNGTSEIAGTISVTETDTYVAGVPDTDTKVHCQIRAGEQQTEKAATTISSQDYWIVTKVYADVLEKTASFAEIEFQVRDPGKIFRHRLIMAASSNGGEAVHEFKPYFIIPKNSDVRLTAIASGAGTDVSGGIEGVLAKVI